MKLCLKIINAHIYALIIMFDAYIHYTLMYSHPGTYTRARVHTHMHTYTHACIRTHTLAYAHSHAYQSPINGSVDHRHFSNCRSFFPKNGEN